ncbi:hypothetical protein CVT26_009040 [Gymnopilus dilepis]|uniref:Uncharacterized protein n=1 Tax=Gymnopilus dilepis TaxID=231916 RepID=A0A409YB08_9AGAR|nr:hypothetical protein CVT26_009040 [Gymnopilus dilepis]
MDSSFSAEKAGIVVTGVVEQEESQRVRGMAMIQEPEKLSKARARKGEARKGSSKIGPGVMKAFEEKEKGGRALEVIRDIVELGRDRHRKKGQVSHCTTRTNPGMKRSDSIAPAVKKTEKKRAEGELITNQESKNTLNDKRKGSGIRLKPQQDRDDQEITSSTAGMRKKATLSAAGSVPLSAEERRARYAQAKRKGNRDNNAGKKGKSAVGEARKGTDGLLKEQLSIRRVTSSIDQSTHSPTYSAQPPSCSQHSTTQKIRNSCPRSKPPLVSLEIHDLHLAIRHPLSSQPMDGIDWDTVRVISQSRIQSKVA